ncbi:MAG: 4'-phosphopantetheinyl transferase family protein [Panacagrimonas sp.]
MVIARLLPYDPPLRWESAVLDRLDARERERFRAYRTDARREQFLLGRLLLRDSLAAIGGEAVAALDLATTSEGKLWLPAVPDIQFSVSHTAGLVAVAVSERLRVGIDIEVVKPRPVIDALGAGYYAPDEQRWLATLRDGGERERAFYRLWTHKEAVMKALGIGVLPGDPRVQFEPDEASGHLRLVSPLPSPHASWTFWEGSWGRHAWTLAVEGGATGLDSTEPVIQWRSVDALLGLPA